MSLKNYSKHYEINKMKHALIAFGMTMILALLGMGSVGVIQADSRASSVDATSIPFPGYGRMGPHENRSSYEGIYLHASLDNQAWMDAEFASQIMSVDIQSRSVTEVMDIIKLLQADILNQLPFEASVERFAMMGSNSPRYGIQNSPAQLNANSYEWGYLHSNRAQRDRFDTFFAEAIMKVAGSNQSLQEWMETIKAIKTEAVNQS